MSMRLVIARNERADGRIAGWCQAGTNAQMQQDYF